MLNNQSSATAHGIELLVAYHQQPTIAVRNQIVKLNLGLVRKIAHSIHRQCTEPYEDLEQIGCLGLIRAIERFNPAQGCAFSSFAVPYIRGEILHFLRDKSSVVKLPRRWQDLKREGQKIKETLMKELGRQPSEMEIAQRLNISLQEWIEVKVANQNRLLISLDSRISQQTDNVVTLGETLADARYQVLQDLEQDRQQLQSALNQLEEDTRDAIEFVFLKGLSRKEVAKKIGISPMTLSRRIQRGIEEMMMLLSPQEQNWQMEP